MNSTTADELCKALGDTARKAWKYRGYVFVAVAKTRLSDLKQRIDVTQFVIARSDKTSVVLKSRQCFSSYWSERATASANNTDPVVRRARARQTKQLNNLLRAHPIGVSDESEKLLSVMDCWISDEERCGIEDELDYPELHPDDDTYRFYHDDFSQPDTGINTKISDFQWRKCDEKYGASLEAEPAPTLLLAAA